MDRTVLKKWGPSRQSCPPTPFITQELLLAALAVATVSSSFNLEAVRCTTIFLQNVLILFHFYILGETLQIRISWDEYRDKIVDYGHIKIFAMASVQETK